MVVIFFLSPATNKTKLIALSPEIQNSDERFLELIRGNQPRILKICRVYAWNQEDQADLYQEILFQIWRSLPNLKTDSLANTWIYRIALNTAITFVRKRAGRADRIVPYDHPQAGTWLEHQPAPTPEVNEQLSALYEAIAKLDSVEKALITLFLEDLSYEQIAEVMGVSSGNVGVMLHRAKKKLAVLMKEASHE